MYFFRWIDHHKMLAVLCSLRPGRGVCRRLGWRHPLRAQRQRWMCSGFGMRWCGWVIGRCERPRVKILRWERDAFIPPTPPPASLFLYHLNSLSPFFSVPLINPGTHFQPVLLLSPLLHFGISAIPSFHGSDRKVLPFQLYPSQSFIFHLLLCK